MIPTRNSDKIPTNKSVGIWIPTSGISKYLHVSVGIMSLSCTMRASTGLSVSIWQLSVSISCMRAVCASIFSQVGLVGHVRKVSGRPSEWHWHAHTGLVYSHSLFKWQGPGSQWATPWPTCWCRTGDCPSLARPDDRTRPVDSTRPCCSACFGGWRNENN